jgi:uncharacterized paraquat-inducible protein A
MKNSKIIKSFLKEKIKYFKYYNNLAPFPVFPTELIIDYENKINEINMNKTKEYDDEPVVACRHCKSLHIEFDDTDNNVCVKCGSVNETKDFENIYKYKEWLKNKDE